MIDEKTLIKRLKACVESSDNSNFTNGLLSAINIIEQQEKIIQDNGSGRKFLFRAKKKGWRQTGETDWIYGFYFCMYHNDGGIHMHHFIIPLNTDLSKDRKIGEIQVEIDPNTLCQYIGITDRNDTTIYENDVCIINGDEDDEYYTIEWDNDEARYIIDGSTDVTDFERHYGHELEIVGNAFDNPELR